jgi:prolyl-tRNA synthetase
VLGVESVEPADAGAVEGVTGAPVGFAGPVGLEGVEMVVDPAVGGIADGVAGANRADAHVVGVVPGRDFALERVEDIRNAGPGDACAHCGGDLSGGQGIEVGHVFRLGTKYSEAFGARYLGPDGAEKPYVMGCYGFGVSRAVAAVIEAGADEHGIVWPPPVAPYEVLVMPLDMSEARVAEAAERAYEALRAAGLEALLDDRDERPGVKFKDADLIGVPVRVVVGKGYLRSGRLEVQIRQDGSRGEVEPAKLPGAARRALDSLATTVFTAEGAPNPA